MRYSTLLRSFFVLCGIGAMVVLVAGAEATLGGGTSYTPATPVLATITNGASAAPWNLSQGDSGLPAFTGAVLPTYTPSGPGSPNLGVYPGATSGTDGNSPYPSGTVGSPGPLAGYCGSGSNAAAALGSPVRQPAGTTLPLAPAYFPHVVRNADGSLTGYFDYRPKDADEAIVAGRSTDNGVDWTYEGEALEQDPGYCPNADVNDDGQGHPNVITVDGVPRLYTLQRSAGDNDGVGMLVHALTPTAANPLAGLPATEKVGVDPDDFASAAVAVPFTGGTGVTIAFSNPIGTGPEALVAGGFVDLARTPVPTASSVINCTGVGASSLTGCTTTAAGGISVQSDDLIEQVIATVTSGLAAAPPATGCTLPCVVPSGPNTTTGDGGLEGFNIAGTNANNLTLAIFNLNAPNRAYIDGVAVYCNQSNALPTTKLENCTTGPGAAPLTVHAGDPLTADPIIPATAQQTSGLVAPDGIVGVLPSYTGAPAGSTIVMYTEKVLNYFFVGYTGAKTTFTANMSIPFTPFPNTSNAGLGTGPTYTVAIGDATTNTIVQETCSAFNAATNTLSGCNGGTVGDMIVKNTYLGAPGAATTPAATLAQIGEGGATNSQKLFKNNQDLTVLRVAYTTDGVNFSSAGLAGNGVISGASNGVSSYTDVNNPTSSTSPSNLNAYAKPGTALATEMRFVGSAGTIIVNPDGSYGMFLSGAWAADGDSDAFNQIYYTSSTDGQNWTIPVSVVSTDYTFAASVAQANALAGGHDDPLGISAYYSGRAYGPSVVQNANGTLTMVFAGYRLPAPVGTAGAVFGTNGAARYTVGATDPALYRNILETTLSSMTMPRVATTTTVVPSIVSPTYGDSVTYTATVAPSIVGPDVPTGTVAFTDNSATIPGCANVQLPVATPDIATCTMKPTAGMHSVRASYSGDSNYQASSQTITQNVSRAVLTVTADNKTRLFGHANPAFTTTITGFVNNDPPGVVTGAASCSTTAVASSIGGPYPITCTTGTLAAANYSFTFVPGTLTVTYTIVISGDTHGPLHIGAGEAVELAPGVTHSGPLTIDAGASVDIEGATLHGPITGDGGGTLRICGSSHDGPLTVTNATGPVVVGGASAGCDRNTNQGAVDIENNTGGVNVQGNTINSSLTVLGNGGTVVDSPNSVSGKKKLQ